MTKPPTIRETGEMIAALSPRLVDGEFAFLATGDSEAKALSPLAIATFRESEGLSLILPLRDVPVAMKSLPMRQITLSVNSSLEGVGLTAAVATALAAEGIPCNMVAAYHHDHVFVPSGHAEAALRCLKQLQSGSGE